MDSGLESQGQEMISKAFIILMASFALAVFIARFEGIHIVTTDSAAPAGIYRTVDRPLAHGELVLACLPPESARLALARSYIGGGSCPTSAEPIAKMVGALPGDTVELEQAFVAIDGVRIPNSPTVPYDSMGRPLEHAVWGIYRVPAGEVWLFGFNNPRSWDGRYFGALPTTNVLGALRPLITW
jgi:conjugative transfer signal peptidase TraF